MQTFSSEVYVTYVLIAIFGNVDFKDSFSAYRVSTLRFLINVLDPIRVLVGNFVKIDKHTGPNKHTGAKLLT